MSVYCRYLAYGSASDRYKAIALDGTLFQRSGLISGGGQELRARARKWDENAIRSVLFLIAKHNQAHNFLPLF